MKFMKTQTVEGDESGNRIKKNQTEGNLEMKKFRNSDRNHRGKHHQQNTKKLKREPQTLKIQ